MEGGSEAWPEGPAEHTELCVHSQTYELHPLESYYTLCNQIFDPQDNDISPLS